MARLASEGWEGLRAFESRDVIEQERRRATGRTPNAGLSHEIASNIVQGREYFEAAANTGELVRPLLIYYGTLALSRAVIMYRSGRRECALSPGHGLTADGWGNVLAKRLAELPSLRMSATSGTFAELAQHVDDVEELYIARDNPTRVYGPEKVVPGGTSTIPPGFSLTVASTWNRFPQLLPLLHGTHGASLDCWPAAPVLNGVAPSPVSLTLDLFEMDGRLPTPGDAQRMLGLATPPTCETGSRDFRQVSWMADSFRVKLGPGRGTLRVTLLCPTEGDFLRVMRQFKRDPRGGQFLTTPLAPGVTLSSFALLFAAAFSAGMLVRYHPTRWHELVRQAPGDKGLVILRKTVDLVEEVVPILAIQSIVRPFARESAVAAAPTQITVPPAGNDDPT